MTRRDRLLGDLDLASASGLEIGALNAPLVKRSEGRVRYVDYAVTEVVRANRNDPNIDPDSIVEVDIVWGERPLVEAAGEKVDYVVASHVIEHVPDLIGWLGELADVLKPGGTLGLIVPDKRFTFDRLRADTTVADAVEAWLDQRRLPPPRQILDVAHRSADASAGDLWNGVDVRTDRDQLREQLKGAYTLAKRVHDQPRYVDIHCWVFTPESFLDLVEEFATIGRFPFRIQAFHPTAHGEIEFSVRLSACTDPADPAILAAIAEARLGLADAPRPVDPPTSPAARVKALQSKVQALSIALDGSKAEIAALHSALEAAEADAAALREEVAAYRGSTSWRVTAPLRALVRLFGR